MSEQRVVWAARALAATGAILVAVGAGMVYAPAGVIVLGGMCLAVGVGALR